MDESEETLESLSNAGWYNNWLIDQFKENLKGTILEVGCGIGNFSGELVKFGKVYAIDVNKKYLTRFNNPQIRVGFGDIEKEKYFFNKTKFDCIVCINVLEHIKNDNQALENMYNLLKPGGSLVLLVPAHKLLYGEIDRAISHYRRYEKLDLQKLIIKNNFKIRQLKRLNFLGGLGWFVSGRILKNKTVDKNKIFIFNLLAPFFMKIEKFIEPPLGTSLLVIAQKGKR
jgi:2-polyprenyl-3-methyl-5-hydroxy-6-metoxy-1,4-benzoquinol methylase